MFARIALVALAGVAAVSGQAVSSAAAPTTGGTSGGATNAPIINSPASLTTCQPAAITWSGGQGPYFIAVIPGGQASAAPLTQFPEQSGTTYTWVVNVAAGTSVSLRITDGAGNINYSDPKTVLAGTDTSCLSGSQAGAGASSAAGGASAPASAPAGGSSAPAQTSARSGAGQNGINAIVGLAGLTVVALAA